MNPRVTSILSALTAFLTILAALPYELGAVADVFPPEVKKYVAIIGSIATVVLRLVKQAQVAPPVAVTLPTDPQ